MKISELAFVLRLTISCWGAEKVDRSTSEEILSTKNADSDAGKFTKRLLGGRCPELDAIKKYAMWFRTHIASMTIPCGHSSYVFPVEKTQEILNTIREGQLKYDELVKEFLDAYPRIVANAKIKSSDLYVEGQCPSVDHLLDKFNFKFRLEPLPESNGFDTSFNLEGIQEDLKKDFDEKIDQMFESGESQLIDRLASRIVKVRQSMMDYVGKKGQLKSSVITGTVDLIKSVRDLNIRSNPSIDKWCRELDILFLTSAETFRSDVTLRREGIQELGRILQEMQDGPHAQIISDPPMIAV